METKKSIQDIKPSNSKNFGDIMLEKPAIRKKTKKVENDMQIKKVDDVIDSVYMSDITPPTPKPAENIKPKKNRFSKIINIIKDIKPFYLISFLIIIIGLAILIFIPNKPKDVVAQSKKEAEMVKKELSRHMILPIDEQIDIRKITSKMEDPFFKDAQIGDYLIIFYKNRIAYIYSIDRGLIINTGVVFIDPKTATTTGSTTKKQ
jgi:competence protein ComGC